MTQYNRLNNPRLRAHSHNAHYGAVKMANQSMRSIGMSPTATTRAKELAAQASNILDELALELYTNRVELDGTIKQPRHKGDEELERLREHTWGA